MQLSIISRPIALSYPVPTGVPGEKSARIGNEKISPFHCRRGADGSKNRPSDGRHYARLARDAITRSGATWRQHFSAIRSKAARKP